MREKVGSWVNELLTLSDIACNYPATCKITHGLVHTVLFDIAVLFQPLKDVLWSMLTRCLTGRAPSYGLLPDWVVLATTSSNLEYAASCKICVQASVQPQPEQTTLLNSRLKSGRKCTTQNKKSTIHGPIAQEESISN